MSDNVIDNNLNPTPSGGETPATPAAAPAAPGVSAGTPPSNPANPAPDGGQPPQGWVPSYRLREAQDAAARRVQQEYEQKMAQIRAEADRYRTQLHSVVGATPPQNPEVAQIREQFFQLFPWAKKLEDRFGDIERLAERASDLETQTEHYWQSYGRQTMDRVYAKASESLGAPLTDEGKRILHSSFVGWIQSSPELAERYATDPTLVDEFWRAYSSTFIDPARRAATATAVGRIPQALPQDAPGGAPRPAPVPGPRSLEERAAAAWSIYDQTKRG